MKTTTATATRELDYAHVSEKITKWLHEYAKNSGLKGYVIGVSGGIDSAVVSTLCARTGLPLVCMVMPIHQEASQTERGVRHIEFLQAKFAKVDYKFVDLTTVFDAMHATLTPSKALGTDSYEQEFLAMANTRSRLRMTALYACGNAHSYLVAGTGNKVEDYGIGFFTKFGDGGVDVSPIGELTKTEVYGLAAYLGINQEILDARPTDGLWTDGRTDEEQLKCTYSELEWAMEYYESPDTITLTERQAEVLSIYTARHLANQHKMSMPPVCSIK
jgi:NAD+ synthase